MCGRRYRLWRRSSNGQDTGRCSRRHATLHERQRKRRQAQRRAGRSAGPHRRRAGQGTDPRGERPHLQPPVELPYRSLGRSRRDPHYRRQGESKDRTGYPAWQGSPPAQQGTSQRQRLWYRRPACQRQCLCSRNPEQGRKESAGRNGKLRQLQAQRFHQGKNLPQVQEPVRIKI